MKGHSSSGTCLVSTKKKPTKMVITMTQQAKKRNVAHCKQQVCYQLWHVILECTMDVERPLDLFSIRLENDKSANIESAVWHCDCMSTAVLTEKVIMPCRNVMTH